MTHGQQLDPFQVDVNITDTHWSVTLRLGDTVPDQVAQDVVEALVEASRIHPGCTLTQADLVQVLRQVVITLDPEEACNLGEQLTRAGSHPGECTRHHCRRLHFNAGLCRSHWLEQQDAVEARLAAQGFAVGGRTA